MREELIEMAKKTGAKIEIISTDTEEGLQFYNMTGGVGALLRWATPLEGRPSYEEQSK